MGDRWGLYRVGAAATATTVPGTPPAYGLAYDLGTAQWQNSAQFETFVRDVLAQQQAGLIAQAEGVDPSLHDKELEIATNYQELGYGLSNDSFANADDDDENWLNRRANDLKTGFSLFGNKVKQGAAAAFNSAGGGERESEDIEDAFGAYTRAGGLLTEEEFNSFDDRTRRYLIDNAKVGKGTKVAAESPGIKQALSGLHYTYKGLTVPAIIAARNSGDYPVPYLPSAMTALAGPHWFRKDDWSSAWREANEKSLGNALLDAQLRPYAEQDTLDEWRRENSLYQMSSVGVEIGATWYADPLVLGLKGAGNAARISKGEMPINETGKVYKATQQALQREQITVRGPIAPYAKWRAGRVSARWEDVTRYAQETDLAEFSRLPMFRQRAVDGQPAAFALHYAANSGSPELLDLTRQMMHGDPKAYAKIESLKQETPEALQKFAPGARTFIDAIEATKTRVSQFEREADDLARAMDELDQAGSGTRPFYRWELHADHDAKVRDLTEAQSALQSYEGYGAWLDTLGTKAGDKSLPLINQVNVPKVKLWSSNARPSNSPTKRFFLDNNYGWAHSVREIPRSTFIQRANAVSMHDMNSGAVSIQRQFDQFSHLFGYADDGARDATLQAWHRAPTSMDRYNVVRELEETHLINAAAQRFGVDAGLIRAIYDKTIDEQNKLVRALQQGDGAVYSSAPTLGERVAAERGSVKLLNRSEDGKTVQIEVVNGRQRTTMTVPTEALVEKVRPVDVTQTPNYYNPIDTREFYLALKRNSELLDTLNKGKAAKASAWTMEEIEHFGTLFNSMWKPLQLFRLGWPQRVLMDEGMRAMAIFGPMYWVNGAGGEAVRATTRNAISYPLRMPYFAKRFGVNRALNVGDGPVTRVQARSENPFTRELEVVDAPQVPESLAPRINRDRQAGIANQVGTYSNWRRIADKNAALRREGRTSELVEGPEPFHPASAILRHREQNPGFGTFDPITGRPAKAGFVVPLPHTATRLDGPRSVTNPDAHHWYETHSELLSAQGYRIVVDDDGSMMVGRWFDSRRRRQAEDFARHLDEGRGRDLSNGEDFYVRIEEDEAENARLLAEAEAEDAARANGELRSQERTAEDVDFDEFDLQIDSAVSRAYRAISERRRTGKGLLATRTADGKLVSSRAAYEGHEGEMMHSLTASDKTFDALIEAHGRALSLLRRQAAGHKTYHPPAMSDEAVTPGTKANKNAVEYFTRWADLMNNQIAHSPIWSKMLKGWDDGKIVRWLEATPEGAVARREVMDEGWQPELWVNEHRAKLDYYLPNKELQRLLGKDRLDASMLRRHVHNDDLPDVYGPDLHVLDKRIGAGQALATFRDKIWRALGSVPVDALSRHPFAKAMYDTKMRSLIGGTDSKWLDDVTISRMEDQSHRFAMEQVKRVLWDLTDQTNFTEAMRFIFPFWGAQQESLVKWARIITDRPETVGRFYAGQRSVYNNFAVIDEEGNPVEREGFFYQPKDRVLIRIPEAMRKTPFGKALETVGEVGVPVGSANTVLQGEFPLMPGAGPLVTIPADKFLRAADDTLGVTHDESFLYRWLFPIGRPQHGGTRGVLDQLLPGWGKRVAAFNEGEGGVAYANLYTQTAREMQLDHRERGLPDPTPGEIEKQARFVWGLRIFSGLVSPVQTEFRPKHQFLVDAAHKYQREEGQDWFDKFMDDYGVAVARYAASSSNTVAGVPPTSEGMEEWAANKELIAKYPEWGNAIISPDAYDDDFSSDAYYAQFQINLGPGDSRTLREPMSAQERLAKADRQAGWYEYRKFNAAITAELSSRGLTSLQQNEAADLAGLKDAFVADLTKRNNAWRADYDTFSDDIYSRVHELEQFAFRREFDSRPDMQGVRQYLMLRDGVANTLDQYAATTGGSRSLQAEENANLRQWFYGQVVALVQANPAFGEFYSRHLEGDKLTEGSGDF